MATNHMSQSSRRWYGAIWGGLRAGSPGLPWNPYSRHGPAGSLAPSTTTFYETDAPQGFPSTGHSIPFLIEPDAWHTFEVALAAELAEVMADFKTRAAAAAVPDDLWAIEEHLARTRRELDAKYDYRYSQLPLVFGRLLREGRIQEADLAGLDEEKRGWIRRIASFS